MVLLVARRACGPAVDRRTQSSWPLSMKRDGICAIRIRKAPDVLFRHGDARAPQFFRHVPQFAQSVPDTELRFRVVHVNARVERKIRNDGGIHVDQVPAWVLGEVL